MNVFDAWNSIHQQSPFFLNCCRRKKAKKHDVHLCRKDTMDEKRLTLI